MIVPYATLRDVRFELREEPRDVTPLSNPTVHDPQMLGFLVQATKRIMDETGLYFLPFKSTESYDPATWQIDWRNGLLTLPAPLHDLPTAVTAPDGGTLDSSLYTEWPFGRRPIRRLRLTDGAFSAGQSWFAQGRTSQLAVAGTWGYASDPANAWLDTLDTIRNNPLAANATEITVSGVNGVDSYGMRPRFSPGQLLRAESEYIYVITANEQTNKLTVRRAMHGTAAAEHVQGTALYVYEVEPDIRQACTRWAAYPYKRRGNYQTSEYNAATGVLQQLPADMPGEVADILGRYQRGSAYVR